VVNRPSSQAIGEELRPFCENADPVRRLLSHPWLVEQANATAAENNAIICSKWYQKFDKIIFHTIQRFNILTVHEIQ
jgi:hypothetical protein